MTRRGLMIGGGLAVLYVITAMILDARDTREAPRFPVHVRVLDATGRPPAFPGAAVSVCVVRAGTDEVISQRTMPDRQGVFYLQRLSGPCEVVVAMSGHRTKREPIVKDTMVVTLALGPKIVVRYDAPDETQLPDGAVHFAATLHRGEDSAGERWLKDQEVSTSERWLQRDSPRGVDLHAVDPASGTVTLFVPGPGTYHLGWRLQRHQPAQGPGASGGMTTSVGTGPRQALRVEVAEGADALDVVYEVDRKQLASMRASMGDR